MTSSSTSAVERLEPLLGDPTQLIVRPELDLQLLYASRHLLLNANGVESTMGD